MSAVGCLFSKVLAPSNMYGPVRAALGTYSTGRSPNRKELEIRPEDVNALGEALQCSATRAGHILKKNPILLGKIPDLNGIVASFEKCGLRPRDLAANPQLLTAPQHELTERISLLRQWYRSNMDITPKLLNLPAEEIKNCIELIKKSGNKIKQFAAHLSCSEIESVKLFLKYPILVRSKPGTLKTKIDTLIEGGISRDDLIRDLWILTYTNDRLKERLRKANEMNTAPIKPWMLRCNEKIIYRSWINKEMNRAALAPLSSSKEYLCQRLDMTEVEMQVFASKHPPVMRVQVGKLKEIIDYLLAEGFTQTQIYNTPRILCHSLTTIQERLSLLREKKYEPYTLSLLCKSEKNFNEFLYKLNALLNIHRKT